MGESRPRRVSELFETDSTLKLKDRYSFSIHHRMLRRKGKDKAKEHFQKTGKYDGKATRRLVAFYEKLDRVKMANLETFPVPKN